MSIEPNDIRITQYIFDELAVDERTAFEIEMREDSELQKLVRETQATIASLTSALDDESSVALTQEQRGKLEQAISHADASPVSVESPSSLSRSKKLISVIAVAASLMLIVSAVMFFKRPQQIAGVGSGRDTNNAISGEINETHRVSVNEEMDEDRALPKRYHGS
jgi:anti-sigma-K factor RskA